MKRRRLRERKRRRHNEAFFRCRKQLTICLLVALLETSLLFIGPLFLSIRLFFFFFLLLRLNILFQDIFTLSLSLSRVRFLARFLLKIVTFVIVHLECLYWRCLFFHGYFQPQAFSPWTHVH